MHQGAGDTSLTWNDRGLPHGQNSYQNYLLCQSTRPGVVLAEKSQGTFLMHFAWKSACVSSLGYAISVHWSSTNTPGVLKRISFMCLVFSWRIRVDEKPRSDFIPTVFLL